VQPDRVSDALVALHDLAATLLDYAGAAPLPEMDSRSLRAVFAGQTASEREFVVSALGAWRMIFDGRYKLVLSQDAAPQLFDRQADPWEDTNIAGAAPTIVDRLCHALDDHQQR
jgi:arylsulfatase A-like enzyme